MLIKTVFCAQTPSFIVHGIWVISVSKKEQLMLYIVGKHIIVAFRKCMLDALKMHFNVGFLLNVSF